MEEMARILKDNNFGHLTGTFLVEKISPDLVSSLSAHEMNELGVTDRGDMMKLRMACSMFECQTPHRQEVGPGAPAFDIPKLILEGHLEEGFKIREMASMLSVSESTVYRRMQGYGLSSLDFSIICYDELDRHILEISKEFPFCGEGMMQFILRQKGIKVQRIRLGIHRVDQDGAQERKKGRLQRKV